MPPYHAEYLNAIFFIGLLQMNRLSTLFPFFTREIFLLTPETVDGRR
jgi:hypothetical protein